MSRAAGQPRARRFRGLDHRERWFYLLIAPWLAGFLLFQAGPIITAAVLAFAEWKPPLPLRWTGLANLETMAGDPRFWQTVANTAVYAVGTVVPGLAIGLGLAILLRPIRRGGTLLRSAVFLPAIISGVATALVWGWLLNPRFGLLNAILGIVGIRGPAWLQDPGWAMPSLIVIGLWNVGINVVVYLAALSTVPGDLLDAAALEGAGPLARFRYVTWPALTPITFYLAIVDAIGAFQVFTPTYLLTGGGPDHATLTLALYTYQNAFSFGQLGYASALAIGMVVIIVALTAVQFHFLGRRIAYLGADA